MNMRPFLTVALLAVLGGGCSLVSGPPSSAGDGVRRGDAVVYIYPASAEPYRRYSVGVLPFLLPANLDPRLGASVASMYKDVLLGKRVFPVVRLLDDEFGDYGDALAAGARAGVDLVLAGKVNYLMEGTELGGARVDVSVRLLNVHSGQTVWYIGQALDQPMEYPRSDMLHFLADSMFPPEIRRAEGGPAAANMLARSAVDMAEIIGGGEVRRF